MLTGSNLLLLNMRQYLCEGLKGAVPFIVERTKPIVVHEGAGGVKSSRIPGRFSVCDSVNGNNRRYSKKVWEKNLAEGSPLQESIKANKALGLLEHPSDGLVTLLGPISHHVTRAQMVESKDEQGRTVYEVVGEIELYETEDGNKLKALIEGGYNPLVSSRGFGSLTKAPDGVDEVCDDFVCEGWDVVAKPSFESAQLTPERGAPLKHASAIDILTRTESLSPKQPAQDVVVPSVSESKISAPQPNKIMQINEVKASVLALRGQLTGKVSPQLFAESVQKIEELHQQAAAISAADSKLAYEAQRIHKELDGLTESITAAISAPTSQVKALREQNNKLMQVLSSVAKQAVTLKKKLGEALSAADKDKALIKQLVNRGQGWQRVAESRKQKYAVLDANFSKSCEALEIMTERYHTDTTNLGRGVLMQEFKDKIAANPAIQKQLKESTRLRHIASIRAVLEGKAPEGDVLTEGGKKKAGVGKPADGKAPELPFKKGEKGAKGDCVAEAPTTESKEDPKGASLTEGKKAPGTVLLRNTFDPRGLTESVAMVKRLSTAKQ